MQVACNGATVHKAEEKALLAALKQCGKRGDLERGKALHLNASHHTNKYIANALINMYGKCGSMLHARMVFESMPNRDVVLWTNLLLGYVENGESLLAMDLFSCIDCEPDSFTFVAVLKACASVAGNKEIDRQLCLERGMYIHKLAKQRGCATMIFVATNLVDMYSKCGSMCDAMGVFVSIVSPDVVAWTSLIMGYVENGESLLAMDLFTRMDCEPNFVTFIALVKACMRLAAEKQFERGVCLEKGMYIHGQARVRGLDTDIFVGNSLVEMYGLCGSMLLAEYVFRNIASRNVFSWTNLMLGYVENGKYSVALGLFTSMDCEPDSFTFVVALKACTGLACLEMGMAIHRQAEERGFTDDYIFATNLVDMYSKCRSMDLARDAFDKMVYRDVVAWTSLILGYVENMENSVAVDLLQCMDCEPDYVTFVAALKACGASLEMVMAIHARARALGLDSRVFIANTLLEMYIRCGSILDGHAVFDNMVHKYVISWNILILGYVEDGQSLIALELFMSMDCEAEAFTLVAALKACTGLASEEHSDRQWCLEKGMDIHRQAKEHGLDTNIFFTTKLVEMYSRCGSIRDARGVFDNMDHRDVVTWTSLILGYVENGESSEALELFMSMDCEADTITFVAVLKACKRVASVRAARAVHAQICKFGLEEEQGIANCLVDVYGKCGSMACAEQVFNIMQSRDIVSWNAMITGYTALGETYHAFRLVKEVDIQMDRITYISILTACSNRGMVEEGIKYFKDMPRHGVIPCVEHYTCVVNMLGKANRLQDALEIIRNMPLKPDTVVWTSLLGTCRELNNMEVGKVAFDALVACDKMDTAAYVLMGDMYKG